MTFREIIRQYPFFRMLLAITIGILIADNFKIDTSLALIILLVCSLLVVCFVGVKKLRQDKKITLLFGAIITLFFISLGVFRTSDVANDMLLTVPDSCSSYKVRISDYVISKPKTDMLQVDIKQAYYQQQQYNQQAKAILYIAKNKQNKNLKPGDCLWLKTPLQRVVNNLNPNEFDYARYLKTQHILYRGYLEQRQFIALTSSKLTLREKALKWRENLLKIYRDKGINGASYDILAALTLGNKTNIDIEIKQAWINAGAIHVLAVSGLHVGIIYLIMNFFLQYFLKWKYGYWIRAILLLISLWIYALITGLSPSVMRATCMFSFVIIGEALQRKSSVFNALAASAFVLLIYDPYLLFSVGFQFSYLAVFGIVFLQPKIERLIYVRNKILYYFWQLTTVSLAAQLVTFPLSIYYFNQFPTYFLLSGYVVIVSAGILIYLSVLLLLFYKIDFIADSIAWILQYLIDEINHIIVALQELPGAVVANCYFSAYQVVILYLLLLSILFVVVAKQKKALFYLLLFLLLLQLPRWTNKVTTPQQEFVVFNTPKNTLLALKRGRTVLFLHNKSINSVQLQRLTKPYILANRIKHITTDTLCRLDALYWKNKCYMILSDKEKYLETILQKYQPSVVIVRKKGLKNESLLNSSNIKYVIDNSVPYWDIKRCKLLTNKTYMVKNSGALILK